MMFLLPKDQESSRIVYFVAMSLYNIVQRSDRATIRLSYSLRNGMEKLARIKNHLTLFIELDCTVYLVQLMKVHGPKRSEL